VRSLVDARGNVQGMPKEPWHDFQRHDSQSFSSSLPGISAGLKLLPHAPLKSEQGAQKRRFLPNEIGETALAALILREPQITRLASEGLTNKESSREATTSHGAINVDLHNIYQKLGISNELHSPLWLCPGKNVRAQRSRSWQLNASSRIDTASVERATLGSDG
jgi:DNA-binding CsgD family transcriptional regulator